MIWDKKGRKWYKRCGLKNNIKIGFFFVLYDRYDLKLWLEFRDYKLLLLIILMF